MLTFDQNVIFGRYRNPLFHHRITQQPIELYRIYQVAVEAENIDKHHPRKSQTMMLVTKFILGPNC